MTSYGFQRRGYPYTYVFVLVLVFRVQIFLWMFFFFFFVERFRVRGRKANRGPRVTLHPFERLTNSSNLWNSMHRSLRVVLDVVRPVNHSAAGRGRFDYQIIQPFLIYEQAARRVPPRHFQTLSAAGRKAPQSRGPARFAVEISGISLYCADLKSHGRCNRDWRFFAAILDRFGIGFFGNGFEYFKSYVSQNRYFFHSVS